jgi:predicted ATPase
MGAGKYTMIWLLNLNKRGQVEQFDNTDRIVQSAKAVGQTIRPARVIRSYCAF